MKNFEHWGIKKRIFPDHNYYAVWNNLKTLRLGEGVAKELPPEFSEFYDVGINTSCNACCEFCYVSANKDGINYPDICDTWKNWMNEFDTKIKNGVTITNAPFQIAIGEILSLALDSSNVINELRQLSSGKTKGTDDSANGEA